MVFLSDVNEENLVLAQNQWKITALAYADIYAFNIGMVRDKFMNLALYNWPTLPNAIENTLKENDEITEDFVSNLSPQVKTLSALEYLLFSEANNDIVKKISSSEKRQNYLKFVASDLMFQAKRLTEIWNAPTNYATAFTENKKTGIKGSFNLLFNGLYNLIDTGKVTKIGKPAGLENSSNVDPESTQAFYSNISLELLKRNLLSVRNVYFKENGLGISDYVYSVAQNDSINNSIKNKIEEVIHTIDAVPNNLFKAIENNDASLKELHKKLAELKVFFGTDVQSILSITITSTDNDGD